MLQSITRVSNLLPLVRQTIVFSPKTITAINLNRRTKYSFKTTSTMTQVVPRLEVTSIKIGTHDGVFHCDEILACFILQQLPQYQDAQIIRSRDTEVLKTCDIVVDVGSVFDKDTLRFDHHQKTFNDTFSTLRPEFGDKWTVRLSSAGLIYTYFGEDAILHILKKAKDVEPTDECLRQVYLKIYEYFIQEIDGIDNGVPQFDGEPLYRITTNLSSRVGNFNPEWNSAANYDIMQQFERAKKMVGEEFIDKIVYYATVWWPARTIVEESIKNRFKVHESGEIIELSQICPWKQHFYDLEKIHNIENIIKYCIFGDKPDDHRVICVPVSANSFVCRKYLPAAWRGIRSVELQEASQVKDANFCHSTGFIGGARSREGVLQMAVLAVENKENE